MAVRRRMIGLRIRFWISMFRIYLRHAFNFLRFFFSIFLFFF
jgi:hypothetical protein